MKSNFFITIVVILILFHISCSDSNKYHKLVERELAKDIRNDNLLQGIQFGMNRREFFAQCWELNKKGVFKAGAGNTTVFYELEKNSKKYYVHFYPKFIKGKIVELPVEYTYSAFAPWNPKYSLDMLNVEILDIYKEEYGEDYLEIPSNNMENDTAYVWVDGNRRISVYKNITRNSVTALFFDLTSKKTIDFILEETER
tara:strand:+ start:10342 stop:10938 length:597 start_codon:yes stop_codon:yes gene_type:complete